MKTLRKLIIIWISNNYPQKVLGKFKDEINGKIIIYFIGLKPKAYYHKIYGDDKKY